MQKRLEKYYVDNLELGYSLKKQLVPFIKETVEIMELFDEQKKLSNAEFRIFMGALYVLDEMVQGMSKRMGKLVNVLEESFDNACPDVRKIIREGIKEAVNSNEVEWYTEETDKD